SFASSVTPQYIWRLKYSQSGAFLYAAGDGGSVRRYRQYPGQELRSLGDLYKHRGDVIDMDISPFDECKFGTGILGPTILSLTPKISPTPFRSCHRFKGQDRRPALP